MLAALPLGNSGKLFWGLKKCDSFSWSAAGATFFFGLEKMRYFFLPQRRFICMTQWNHWCNSAVRCVVVLATCWCHPPATCWQNFPSCASRITLFGRHGHAYTIRQGTRILPPWAHVVICDKKFWDCPSCDKKFWTRRRRRKFFAIRQFKKKFIPEFPRGSADLKGCSDSTRREQKPSESEGKESKCKLKTH